MYLNKKICASAALFAALSCGAAPGYSQSLALTYKLDARPDTAQQVPAAMNPCAGFNWMSSIGACGRELLARISLPRADGVFSNGSIFEPSEVAVAPDLPTLGTPGPRSRPEGGREVPITSTRTAADLMFRLGSKYRPKGNDDGGWDAYRFTDTNYETHKQNNGHKAVGVELLVPFQ